mmetsp:Transcript_39387/g.117899  ORF Transcript_39387/g.117899 Transcript_39387/m.117899 type:complete len:446 (+) Transcript_39387:117-1454(+)
MLLPFGLTLAVMRPSLSLALVLAVILRQMGCLLAWEARPLGTLPDPELKCEIDASGPICFGSEDQLLLPPAMPDGVVGSWSFDDEVPLDASGYGNHGEGTVMAGPSLAGQGSSAFFHHSLLAIPGASALALHDFSYTFWLYLIEEHIPGGARRGPEACPVVSKGAQLLQLSVSATGQSAAASPAVLFNLTSRKLHVQLLVASEDGAAASLDVFESNARLSAGRWFHVAVVRVDGQRMTHLYVNGILDSSRNSEGYTMTNQEPLYVGGDPGSRERCSLPMYIDELKVYNRPAEVDEIQAEASPSLAGIEPAMVRLACMECPLETAIQNCPEGYHICSSIELHMGGYQVARALGWLRPSTHVWSRSSHEEDGPRGPAAANSLAALAQPGALPSAAVPAPAQPPSAASAAADGQVAEQIVPAGAPAPSTPPSLMPPVAAGLGLCCTDS